MPAHSIPQFARACAGAVALACALPATAANLGFLNNTPMSYMTQRDIDSVKQEVIVALNTKKDGEAMQWSNQGSGNGVAVDATLTPDGTATEGERTCRSVAVALNAKGQSMNLHPKFCRTGNGQWQLQKRS